MRPDDGQIPVTATVISIHAPRAGCDISTDLVRISNSNFNPRTPCGGATSDVQIYGNHPHISIHAPRAGCDHFIHKFRFTATISIHAPRAGCDLSDTRGSMVEFDFNPRTPCGVRLVNSVFDATKPFQSTHPVRGATITDMSDNANKMDFNPRTPCGVRLCRICLSRALSNFNPRTPCGVRRSGK